MGVPIYGMLSNKYQYLRMADVKALEHATLKVLVRFVLETSRRVRFHHI